MSNRPMDNDEVRRSGPLEGRLPRATVVIPVYQESDTIGPLLEDIVRVLSSTVEWFEVLVVDDGSGDATKQAIERTVVESMGRVRVITHPYNKGNGAAVRTGIEAAQGTAVVCMDGDGQHDPNEIPTLLARISEYDLVVGCRTGAYRGTWYRNAANRFYSALASWLTGFRIVDLTSGFRVFRTSVVRRYVHLFPARFSYPTTSTLAFIKGGHNLLYVPVDQRPRRSSESKVQIVRDGSRFLIIIFKIIIIFEPLRVFLPVAGALFALSVASAGYGTWSLGRLYVPNSAVLFFLSGLLAALLGFIAEQLAALQIHATSGSVESSEE